MTTIYLAGRYSRRAELQGYAEALAASDVGRVQARWLTEDHEWDGNEDQLALARRLAWDDLRDLEAADLVIVFTEAPAPGGRNRGGRHVEYGMALNVWLRGLVRLYIVGPAENVFHSLVPRYDRWDELLAKLTSERPQRPVLRDAPLGALLQQPPDPSAWSLLPSPADRAPSA